MALLKEKINDHGIVTNYHRIDHVSFNDGRLICSLESYVSKDYRENDMAADRHFFTFDVTLQEEESMGVRALGYTKIKSLANWADAQDC